MALKTLLYLFLFAIGLYFTFRRPFNGILVFILMTFIRPEVLSYDQLKGFKLPFIISIIILILFVINYATFRKLINEKTNFYFFSFFVLSAYLSSISAVYDLEISLYYSTELFKILIFCFIMTKLINSVEDFHKILNVIMIGSGFLAIWGFQQHFLGNARLEDVGGGNYAESNSLAALFVNTLPLFLVLVFSKSLSTFLFKNFKKIFGVVISFITVASIIFTESRAAFLGFATIVMVYLVRKKKIKYIITFAVLIIIFYQVAKLVPGYLDRINIVQMQESKGADRVAIWKAAYFVFLDYPITGTGQQNFKYIAKEYVVDEVAFHRLADAHNTLILFLVDGGLLQFLSFLGLIFLFYKDSFFVIKYLKSQSGEDYLLERMLAIEAGMTGLLAANMFHSMSMMENLYWFLLFPTIVRSLLYRRETMREIPNG